MRDICLKALLPLSATLVLGACGTANMSVYPNNGILPNAALKLSPSVSLTIEEMIGVAAVGAAIYYVYDPLAPNWTIRKNRSMTRPTPFLFGPSVSGPGEMVRLTKS